MTAVLRHLGRSVAGLVLYGSRSGRWWMPLLVVVLVVASILIATVKTVVPVTVYTLL
jgi:hypothetical protein